MARFSFMCMTFTSVYDANGIVIDEFFYARKVPHTLWHNYDHLFHLNSAITRADFGPSNILVLFGPSLQIFANGTYLDRPSDDLFLLGIYVPASDLNKYAQISSHLKKKVSLRTALEKLEEIIHRKSSHLSSEDLALKFVEVPA